MSVGIDCPGCSICGVNGYGRKTEPRKYQCSGCKRMVPWCFGAADSLFELCDDCWGRRSKTPRAPAEIVVGPGERWELVE